MTSWEEDNSPEAWLAWFPDLAEQINAGTFDSKLSELFALLVGRSGQARLQAMAVSAMSFLDNEQSLKDTVAAGIKIARTAGYLKSKTTAETPAPTPPSSDKTDEEEWDYEIVGEDGEKIRPTAIQAGTVKIGDRRYLKREIEGKVFRLSVPAGNKSFYLDGQVVKVTTCGMKYATTRFVGDPRPKYPNSTVLAEYWTSQERNADWGMRLPYPFFVNAFQA